MDPHNNEALVSETANQYWRNVDLYMGGAEHATGHLIYSRFWNMFLYDLGVVCEPEPFKKLINQGMIQGRSNFVYRIVGTNTFVSAGLKSQYETTEIHVDVNIVKNDVLDTEAFKQWLPDYANAEFILEDGKYICGWAVEKMSKSMFNVVNPDDIIEQFGADTLRLYEMFLGPLEAHKPWDTQGIDGVYKFLRKFWRLFFNNDNFNISEEVATKEELKILHKTLKKIEYDVENFSFNTSIPAFMICTNELTALKCNKRSILEPLVIALSPYAPHITEELWHLLGHTESITTTQFPQWEEKYLVEDSFEYPVSFNGKVRFKLAMPLTATNAEIEAAVKASPEAARWLEGKEIRKMIIVPKKIVNVVI
jgi:leucyl-tRNA synthetase